MSHKPFMEFDSHTRETTGYVMQTKDGQYLRHSQNITHTGTHVSFKECRLSEATVLNGPSLRMNLGHRAEEELQRLRIIPKLIPVQQTVNVVVSVKPLGRENTPAAM